MMEQSERKLPDIVLDEDIPPGAVGAEETPKKKPSDLSLSKEKDVSLDLKRFSLGSTTLGWCIVLMFLCIVLSIFIPNNELIKSGFEAFKLIVTTILGYVFGSQSRS